MKKLFALIFCMILLVGTVSAFEFDNIKDVDYEKISLGYPEITIKNSFLWIIPLDPILDTKITQHTTMCPNGQCSSEQEFNLYYETAPVEDIKFEDKNGKEITGIDYQLYVIEEKKTITKEIDYEKSILTCSIMTKDNSVCSWDYVYKDVEEIELIKTPYELNQKLGTGKVKILIEADLGEHRFADYIFKSANIWTTEMAGWTTANCAEGGSVVIDGDYCVHTFLSDGSFNSTGTLNVSALIVAGGGGGGGDSIGTQGGGGGAGGLLHINGTNLVSGNHTIIIGAGGSGGANENTKGTSGGNSSLGATWIAISGGGGGARNAGFKDGINGGSGGGSGGDGGTGGSTIQDSPAGATGYGNDGGSAGAGQFGSGGGGAGAVGGDGGGSAGAGGTGKAYDINGTSITYATGGDGTAGATAETVNTGNGGRGGSSSAGGSGGSGIVIVKYLAFEDFGISTTQSYPIDYFNTTDNTIDLACNFTGNTGETITDVTVLVYDSSDNLDYTNTESGLNLTSYNKTWTTTILTDDTYLWACLGEGTSTEKYAGNRTFTIDTTAPIINITSPISIINYHLSGNNLTLNWSISDTFLESCWYNQNGTNINLTCSDNSTQFIVTENSNKNLTFYANDTLGNEDSNFISWNIKIIEINQTYNNETTEGSLETFLSTIRLGTGFSIANVLINYNQTSNSGQSFTSGENTILRKVDLLIPNVDTNTNMSFYWDITLSDSTHINLTTQNQTVYNLNLDNCSTFSTELFNFIVVDEEKQTTLPNATIEIAINIYDQTRTIQIMNLSNRYEKVNPLRICLNRNLSANTTYSLDSIIRYEDTGFANEYYNIINYQITNETPSQIITLYNLNISDSTEFQLTFTGADFLSVEDALVYVNRQYISEDKFKTVELPKTDFNGQTILHLVRNDVVYNIQIIKDGTVLGNFENIVAFCDDFTIGNCNIELNAFDSVENIFDYDSNLGIIFSAPEYNETTNKISFDFVTSDGSSKLVRLEVSRNDIFGNRSLCNDSLTSSGGTLTCNINPNLDETILKTNIYVEEILITSSNVKLDTTNYGVAGYLIMFVMAISFILMFSGSKTGVLISIGLTLAGSIGLGLVSGNLIGIGASGLWLLVIIAIGIYKLNSRRES